MASHNLTDGYVEALRPTGRDHVAWDEGLPRLGVRETPTGRRIYIVQWPILSHMKVELVVRR